MRDKAAVAAILGVGLLLGVAGFAFALPWFIRRRWSTSRPSMWEKRHGT